MKIAVSPDLLKRFPGYRRLVVAASGVINRPEDEGILQALREIEDARREDPTLKPTPESNPRIAAWRLVLAGMGADPVRHRSSVENLALKVAGGNEVAFRNAVAALVNAMSLKVLAPCGAVDIDKVKGDLRLERAAGGEPFTGAEGPERAEPGEVVFRDDERVIVRRWVWRQDQSTMPGEETVNLVIVADLLPEIGDDEGRLLSREIETLLAACSGGRVAAFMLDAASPSAELPAFEASSPADRAARTGGVVAGIRRRAGNALKESAGFRDWSMWDFIHRGVIERIIVREEFLKLLDSGKRIKIYQGFDATTPSLHIGHLVGLRVLRWFQLNGHEVIFLAGDATGMVGDPSGKSAQRAILTSEVVERNLAGWRAQVSKIIDVDTGSNPARILRNSEWLHKLTFHEFLPLMATITIQRLLDRDMFQERLRRGDPLYYIETAYPLLQGYDSVAMGVDAEIGGTDQLYNMLVGRDLVRSYAGREKHVLTAPLLPGIDGRKMGKTEGNAIFLAAAPFDMFDGIMKVNDAIVIRFFMWLTDLSWPELEAVEGGLARDPVGVKERLAFEVVAQCHGEEEAGRAREEFVRVRRKGEKPAEIPEVVLRGSAFPGGTLKAPDLLTATEPPILPSKGEARRMINNKGVKVNDRLIESHEAEFAAAALDGALIQVGKKRIYRVRVA